MAFKTNFPASWLPLCSIFIFYTYFIFHIITFALFLWRKRQIMLQQVYNSHYGSRNPHSPFSLVLPHAAIFRNITPSSWQWIAVYYYYLFHP
jgi:hypothetical protein